MDSFEDAGGLCVDNLPPELVPTLVDLFRREGEQGRPGGRREQRPRR